MAAVVLGGSASGGDGVSSRYFLARRPADILDPNPPPAGGPGIGIATVEATLCEMRHAIWNQELAARLGSLEDPGADLAARTRRIAWFHAHLLGAIDADPRAPSPATSPQWSPVLFREIGQPQLLRAVRRTSVMPVSGELAATLVHCLTGIEAVDIELVRLVGLAPASTSIPLLRELFERLRRGRADPALLEPVCWGLALAGPADILGPLAEVRKAPALDNSNPAKGAIQQIRNRFVMRRGYEALALGLAGQARLEVEDPQVALDWAQVLIWARRPEARSVLTEVIERHDQQPEGASRLATAEAWLGLASFAHVSGADPSPDIDAAIAAVRAHPKGHETWRMVWSRTLFLSGLDHLAHGRVDAACSAFAEAIERAPYRPDENFLDQVLWGRFGPFQMLERHWLETGEAERALDAVTRIEQALRDAPTGLYLTHRSGAPEEEFSWLREDERPVSWLLLFKARLLDDSLGRPEEAIQELTRFALELESATIYANTELLVACREALGRAAQTLLDAPKALNEWNRAIRSALDLERVVLLELAQQKGKRLQEHGAEAPYPEPGFLENPLATWMDAALVPLYLNTASVQATLLGNLATAQEALELAHERRHDDMDVRMAIALHEARRGRAARARRLLDCVEESPYRLYNRACASAMLGDGAGALRLLHEHLERNVKSAGARQRVREYARRDPDLAALRGTAEFEGLLRDE
ncbi:MAG: hypothetical protein AB1486_08390 [Planctomycetota bacterium]